MDEADLLALRSANRCLHAEAQATFREAYFTNRRHEVTRKSLEALYDITRKDHLYKNLKSITFELLACVNVGPELLVYILGAFKNLHERGIRFSVGVEANEDKWERESTESFARFVGEILALSASMQCLTKISVMLPEEYYVGDVWDDRQNDAICAHLATGNDLSFLWSGLYDESDSCACYKSEDHSLTFKHALGYNLDEIHERVCGCIAKAIVKPLEKLHLERCGTEVEDLLGWLEMVPQIKELSVVRTQFSSPINEDWKWPDFLEVIMEMENLEVLLLKDNESDWKDWADWDWVRSHTELSLRGKKNIREGLQRKIIELRSAAI